MISTDVKIDDNRERVLTAVAAISVDEPINSGKIMNLLCDPFFEKLRIDVYQTKLGGTFNKGAYLDANREYVSLASDDTDAQPLQCDATNNRLKIDLLIV